MPVGGGPRGFGSPRSSGPASERAVGVEQPALIVVDVLDARERGDLVARLLRRFVAHAKNPFPGGPPGRGSPGLSLGAGVAGASPSS